MRKNLFARALALVMSLSLLSTTAFAHVVTIEGVDGTQDVDTVQAGVDMIAGSDSGTGSIQLTDTAEENVTIKDGANVTIDLNGNSILGDSSNSVIKVTGEDTSLTLTDNSDAGAGSITGGGGKTGGGIYVDDHASVTMTGGTITGNNVTENGGGVYIRDGGSFTMSGDANINRNSAGHSGGGVFVNNGYASWDHSNFTMEDGTIAENTAGNGDTAAGGGIGAYGHQDASRDEDAVTIHGGEIKDNRLNYTGSDGAGIAVSNGAITMTGGTVSGNTGANKGGGIYIYDSNANISGVTVTGNSTGANAALGYGGGIYAGAGSAGSNVVLNDNTISGNTAKYGGGLFNLAGTVTMNGGEIKGNTGTSAGAGVYNSTNAEFNMNGGSISNNTGTGVYNYYNSTFNMQNGTISNNTRGVWNSSATFNMVNGTISNNTSTGSGGGIYTTGATANVTMNGGSITGNTATFGGGVRLDSGAKFTMNGGSITDNHATDVTRGGGGVYSYNGTTFTMNGGEISGNTADGHGGGLFNHTATFTMNGGQLYGNSASASSDDIYSDTRTSGSITLITAESMDAEIDGETISRWLWDASNARYEDGNYSVTSLDGKTILCLKAAPAQLFTVTVNNGYSEEPILNTTLDRNSKFPTINDPEREGYRFDGWGIELPELVEGNIELTARWTHVDHNTVTVRENEVPAQIGVAGSYDEVTYCTVCGEVLDRVTVTIPALEPDEPEVPDTPDTPDTPDQPDTPDEPGVILPEPDVPLGGAPETETTIEDEAVPLAGLVTLAEMLEELRQREQIEDAELPEDFKFIDHDYAQAIFWALAEGLVVDTEEEPLDPDEIVTVGLLQKVLDNFVANYKEFEDFTTTVEGEADELVMDLIERLAAFYTELELYEAAGK